MTQQEETSLDPLEGLKSLRADLVGRDLNEADTRHRIIDFILHNFLAWPKNRVNVEQHVSSGYIDYVLLRSTGEPIMLVEAKREGIFFSLPSADLADKLSGYISIGKLITDANIRAAVVQVRAYCLDTGCEYAGITNGHEWIFFKIFERNKRWEALNAFVIRDLDFFATEYTRARNFLSYRSITDQLSLMALLTSSPPQDRSIYYAKDRIPSYSHAITANRLASTLRPVVTHYFGVIGDDDPEFMNRCYVSQRDYEQTLDGVQSLLEDSLSPYLANYGVQQLEDTGKDGRFGRLTKSIKRGRKGEVLVLFGGKGAGKSTFIKRLLHYNPPRWLRDHAIVVMLDLLKIPENIDDIKQAIWSGLVDELDTENILGADRHILLTQLFSDRFEVANRQDLSGINRASELYNTKLNQLVALWKNDQHYCVSRLGKYWSDRGRGVIVVLDNTDQYSGSIQDFCFTTAQQIAEQLGCTALISMREERFYNSKIHGVLDAFQNAGFHISSPKPAEVFRKRLRYTIGLLNHESRRAILVPETARDLVEDCARYLDIINREFSSEKSPLNGFLTACAHGDIRLSLDLFRSFLLSGYTNVEEMLAAGEWTFQIHQIIKPVMIPTRYYYDELLSEIPNIYQLRHSRHSSHFTSLGILRRLSKQVDGSTAAYLSIGELKHYFVETFNMLEDFIRNTDILLMHGFIEADNRLDRFSDSVDSVKITGYGMYMQSQLAFLFSYLGSCLYRHWRIQ
jgi:GTPase SAR1 family protein